MCAHNFHSYKKDNTSPTLFLAIQIFGRAEFFPAPKLAAPCLSQKIRPAQSRAGRITSEGISIRAGWLRAAQNKAHSNCWQEDRRLVPRETFGCQHKHIAGCKNSGPLALPEMRSS